MDQRPDSYSKIIIPPKIAEQNVYYIKHKSIKVKGMDSLRQLEQQCSPMAVGPSDISGNDWLGPIDSSPAADHMSDEIFGANLVFWAEI